MKRGYFALIAVMLLVIAVLSITACVNTSIVITYYVDGSVYHRVSVTSKDSVVELPADPVKENDTFLGWYRDYGTWEKPFTVNSLLDIPVSERMSVNIYARFSSSSSTATSETAKLNAPDMIWVDNGYIKWNEVKNASSYTVLVNGEPVTVYSNKYMIDDETKSYVFKVRANGDGTQYVSSDYSEGFSFSASEGYYSQFEELTKKEAFLGYGFDVIKSSVFYDKYVKTSAPILDPNEILNLRLLKVDSQSSVIQEVQSASMEEFMSQWNAQANVDVSYGKKKVGGSVNVEVAYSGGLENAKSKYFHCITINNQKFYIVLQSDLATYKSILSSGFKQDLYSDMPPAELFNRYGTHFITSAVMGGKIYSYYLYTSEEETNFHDVRAAVSAYVRKLTTRVGVDVDGGYSQVASNHNVDINNSLEVLGGSGFGMLSDADIPANYAAWEQSLGEHAGLIGIKDTGSLWPIWDLIDPSLDTTSYTFEGLDGKLITGSRSAQLQAYFYKYGIEKYNDLMQASGLPSIETPTAITNVSVNGASADEKGDYLGYAGIYNDIYFGVAPETATGFTKSIAVVGDNVYAEVNDKNQLYIAPTAPSDLRIQVALNAGGLKKIINIIVRRTYTVTFVANHGNDPQSITNVRYGAHIVEPQHDARDGFEFKGWYSDPYLSESSRFDFINDPVMYDLTLYGKWAAKANAITVTLDGNGAIIDNNTISVVPDGTYEGLPKQPLYDGHTFLGWYYGDTRVDANTKVLSQTAHTLIAKWELHRFTVYVNANDGSPEWWNTVVNYGDPVPAPTISRNEHIFIGWSEKPERMPDHDITITANWLRNKATFTYSDEAESKARLDYSDPNKYQYYCGEHIDWLLDKSALANFGYNKMYVTISFDARKNAQNNHVTHSVINWRMQDIWRDTEFSIASKDYFTNYSFTYEESTNQIWWFEFYLTCRNTGYTDNWFIKNLSVTFYCCQ